MKKLIYLILALLSASGGEVKETNKWIKGMPYISTDQKLQKADTFNEIIETLTKDGFKLRIDSTNNEALTFEMHDEDLEVIDLIKLHPFQIRTIKGRASDPINGTELYPRLEIKEAYFKGKRLTDNLIEKIEKILYHPDLINEKTYDRIIKMDTDRLIYISTDAKAFEGYVDKYSELIRDLKK